MLIYIRQPPERVLGVTIEVRELGPSKVSIRLLTASAFGPEPKVESVRRAPLTAETRCGRASSALRSSARVYGP